MRTMSMPINNWIDNNLWQIQTSAEKKKIKDQEQLPVHVPCI